MAGAVVENLSNRKLIVLISFLLICLLVCFLLGGLVGKFKASVSKVFVIHTSKNSCLTAKAFCGVVVCCYNKIVELVDQYLLNYLMRFIPA